VSARTYRILVVEDNPADAFVIQQAFQECGCPCRLTFAESHEEAQQMVSPKLFDLVLSDFGTLIEPATAFVQSVRARYPRLPSVILSGGSNPNIAYDAGATAFIKKVPDLQRFFEKIRGLMHFWIDVAELPYPERE
jgi:CheY-like chemotaxis protein